MESNYYDKVDPDEIIDKLKKIISCIQNKRKRFEIYNAKEFSNTPQD